MPTYKLTYFSLAALGEPIRFMLSYMGQDFEDCRIKMNEWSQWKSKMPYGKVPILEVDGKVVHQSTAITRYLGRQAKLAGDNDWEALQIDMAVDTITDLRAPIGDYFWDPDQVSKKKKGETLAKVTIPFYLGKFEEQIKQNGGFLANGKLSWGDIYFISVADYFSRTSGVDFFNNRPHLTKLRDTVNSLPGIKQWIQTRPKSDI